MFLRLNIIVWIWVEITLNQYFWVVFKNDYEGITLLCYTPGLITAILKDYLIVVVQCIFI